jgi:hypothetical protein
MKFCVMCNLHFGVSGGFFQGAKLRTLVYAIKMCILLKSVIKLSLKLKLKIFDGLFFKKDKS